MISTLAVADRMLVVARSTVAEGAEVAGQDLAWLHAGPYARVLQLCRNGRATWVPDPATRLEAGDELVVVATRKGLDGLLRRTAPAAVAAAGPA